MNTRTGVWILSDGGSWLVGIGRGYYNVPVAKAAAIKQARQLARTNTSGGTPIVIDVLDDDGELIEQIV